MIAALLMCGCAKSTKVEEAARPAADSETQVISTFNLVGHTETGRKKWEVQGKTADLTGDTIHLTPVTAASFGQVETHLVAEEGTFGRATQDVHLEGDVVVTTSDGARLTTDRFDWRAQRETGIAPGWVTVTRPAMTVMGEHGVTYPKLKRMRLERDVTVTLKGERGGRTVVTCDGPLEVDHGRRRARFWRNVRVRDGKVDIRSDRLDVALDANVNRIDRATFWGHVEIYEKGRTAFCQRARYWQPQGRVNLAGHPRVALLADEE